MGALTPPGVIYALGFALLPLLFSLWPQLRYSWINAGLGLELFNIVVLAAPPLLYGVCFVRADEGVVAKWRVVTMSVAMLITALLLILFSVDIVWVAGMST